MLRTVGKEVIDKHSANREDENEKTPEKLVRDGAVRLQDLNCLRAVSIGTIWAAGQERLKSDVRDEEDTYSRR